ncbi:sensor domain-containing diguanylate cyclase [Paenibacillus pinistramenti]|uniref:GGDEF domain-containing protein n=1 Tax=Paenibacillus pinistramenti TaxID=1768003 RepID=UPI0013968814|nr:GGDEF domain-containing protein [Paenibacillus pinistramenti]
MVVALDMKTVFILVALGHLCTMILITAYRIKFMQDAVIRLFSISKWLQVLIWALSAFRLGLPDVIGVVLPNLILFAASCLEISALLLAIDGMNRRVARFMALLTAAGIGGYLIIYAAYNAEWLRISFASLVTAMYIAYPAVKLAKDKGASALKKTLSVMYGLVGILLLARSVLAVWMTSEMSMVSGPSPYQLVTYFSIFFMMLVGNIGFILLSKEQADDKLVRLASYDDLTGALNRRTFIERTQKSIESLTKSQEPVSFILFDIDHYKRINDTYGHETGDRVLQEMTAAVQRLVQGRGIFGRYGGDEFAVLLPGLSAVESDSLAEQLRTHIALQSALESRIPYTISLGIVTIPASRHLNASMLYQLSDRALYNAKRLGRNRAERHREPAGAGAGVR